jgi:hypothetical protein
MRQLVRCVANDLSLEYDINPLYEFPTVDSDSSHYTIVNDQHKSATNRQKLSDELIDHSILTPRPPYIVRSARLISASSVSRLCLVD